MMIKTYILFGGLSLGAMTAFGQSYMELAEGHKVAYYFSGTDNIQSFDVGSEHIYYCDGDTIYRADPVRGVISSKYGLPEDYALQAFPSFISLSPDGYRLWAGFTDLDNQDARIYSIDIEKGDWRLEARMPANWDLVFWNDSILVSGLNSADFNSPNGIYVLDTSGRDMHRMVVDAGGSSAGLAVNSRGDLFYGSASFTEPNALYCWDSARLAAVIGSPGAAPLRLSDARKLSDLPVGAYDCEVDAGGHLVFTMNTWGGTQVVGRWNSNPGDGYNYDTIATSPDWLGMIKSRGDHMVPEAGNSLFTMGYGQALADIHTGDYAPVLIKPLPVISGYESGQIDPLDLNQYMMDPDDRGGFDYVMIYLSEPAVAALSIEGQMLTGVFKAAGQTNVAVVGTSAGKNVRAETVIGTWPVAEEGLLLADFGELSLEAENYWNGSDQAGGFVSGPARFMNSYNSEYFSWSGWAYSNTSDISTPGFMNQYSAITGEGFHGPEPYNAVYGVSCLYGPALIDFHSGRAHAVKGFYVTNTSYTALSMMEGDMFAKKFGGTDGSDPDFFKLLVWGTAGGAASDTVEFYLADYRFENAGEDYIIRTWQWVDLSSLGSVDTLFFGLESSDNGDYGMNTPAYFSMDNLMVSPDFPNRMEDHAPGGVKVYPNPSHGQFIIESEAGQILDVAIFTITGSVIYSDSQFISGGTVALDGLAAGSYILRILNEQNIRSEMILIQ